MLCALSTDTHGIVALKLAFIVQRYGTDVVGGSEHLCRLIAERLATRHDVEVLTTCARDYVTWKNEYPEGEDRIRGVTVRRFANARERDIEDFNRLSEWIFAQSRGRAAEMDWLERQGPVAPGLLAYLDQNHRHYDGLILFTYLYWPTVRGIRVAPEKSILVPTAHDEPAIRLPIFRDVFSLPAGMVFNTEVERQFVRKRFHVRARMQEVIGCGVEVPEEGSEEPEAAAQPGTGEPETAEAPPVPVRFRISPGEAFRRRHRLHGPFALYGGRIDRGKGCETLIDYFRQYVREGGEALLVLMGVRLMPLPAEPFIRFEGYLPDRERLDALQAATVVVVPSPLESLSLLALEAFGAGTPVLANARSPVLLEHCRASHAGLYYASADEFIEALKLLVEDPDLRRELGRNGRRYIRHRYRWDVIMAKYERMVTGLRRGSGDRRQPSHAAVGVADLERG